MADRFLEEKIVAFDPAEARTANEIVSSLSGCSFQGRSLAFALDVWEAMCRDEDCFSVMSLAGAMVPAGMGAIVVRLIEHKLIDAIVCTGATIAHDMCNLVSQDKQAHFRGSACADDEALRDAAINRVYDTYIPEKAFNAAEDKLIELLPELTYSGDCERTRLIRTATFCEQIGTRLEGFGILTSAAEKGVKIFIPAISDSELGLNVVVGNERAVLGEGVRVVFDTVGDVRDYGELIMSTPRAGLVTIGGGVPRNWAQQIYPYLNMKTRAKNPEADGYHYGVRITTDRPEFGGLSGCTISESKSWGKYENEAVEASVVCDATIALPLLCSALFERLGL